MKRFLSLHAAFPFLFGAAYVCVLFALSLALGIRLLVRTHPAYIVSGEYSIASAVIFLLLFAAVTLALILLVHRFSGEVVLKILFYIALIDGMLISFGLLTSQSAAVIVTACVIGLLWYQQRLWQHDLALLFALGGIAAQLGTPLSPLSALIVCVLLSAYDYLAVLKTRHMVALFKGLAERHVFFALIVPRDLRGFSAWMPQVSVEREYLFIGTGDLALPALLAVSALKQGLGPAIGICIGTLIGFVVLHALFVLGEGRKPLPGLPPLITGAIAGYALSFAF